MAKKKLKPPSLADLSRQPLTMEDIAAWKREMVSGTDHSCALIGAAYIDQVLQQAIRTHFRSDLQEQELQALFESPQAPLSSLASKTSVAYALRHFEATEREDLKTIRHIRNAFAHSPRPLQFDHKLIAEQCRKLKADKHHAVANVSEPRSAYILRCTELVVLITEKTISIISKRRDQILEARNRLDTFATSLKDPSNPLHPHYRNERK